MRATKVCSRAGRRRWSRPVPRLDAVEGRDPFVTVARLLCGLPTTISPRLAMRSRMMSKGVFATLARLVLVTLFLSISSRRLVRYLLAEMFGKSL